MRSFRVTFYNAGCFYALRITAPNEASAWLQSVRLMVVHGHVATKREAWKMKVICLENLQPKPIVPKWENPGYDPSLKREF
jgi:hypothetical protein